MQMLKMQELMTQMSPRNKKSNQSGGTDSDDDDTSLTAKAFLKFSTNQRLGLRRPRRVIDKFFQKLLTQLGVMPGLVVPHGVIPGLVVPLGYEASSQTAGQPRLRSAKHQRV